MGCLFLGKFLKLSAAENGKNNLILKNSNTNIRIVLNILNIINY